MSKGHVYVRDTCSKTKSLRQECYIEGGNRRVMSCGVIQKRQYQK